MTKKQKKWIVLYTHDLRLYLKDRVEFEKEYRQTFYTKDGKHKPIWKNNELYCQTYNNLLKKHNLIISENPYKTVYEMEDWIGVREKISDLADKIIKTLYKKGDRIKDEHINIFKLRTLNGGDDEPFSDCGIDILKLWEELNNLHEQTTK